MGYEVNVNGTGWISPNDGLCHDVTGLTLADTVTLEIYGIEDCDGEIDTLTCWTPDCTPPTGTIIAQTDIFCFGDSTGTVTVEAMGVFPPFIYMLEGIDTNSTGVFTNLTGGEHVIVVLDNIGCPLDIPVTINGPLEIITNESLINNISCNGETDGSTTVTIMNGIPPYSFNWSNGSMDSIISGLSAGPYYVTISDANACTTTDTVNIVEPLLLTLSIDPDSVSCNGEGDGQATVMPNGGTAPYTYQWDSNASNQMTAMATGLSGGVYSVTVSDASNCTEETTVTIIENTAITLMITSTDLLCFGDSDGTATVTANGGTGTYTYQWDDPGMQMTATATNLEAGLVAVTVTDSDGCTANTNLLINQPDAFDISDITVNPLCNGDSNGTITMIVSGSTPPYSYAWMDMPGLDDSLRINLSAGDYTLTVTDADACTEELVISVVNPPSIGFQVDALNNPQCSGGIDGSITISGAGGVAPYSYLWDSNAGNQTDATAINLSAGDYRFTVTDDNGCTTSNMVSLGQASLLVLDINTKGTDCFGEPSGNASVSVQGGLPAYTYQWSNGATTNEIDSVTGGTYMLTVTDNAGCSIVEEVIITQPEELDAQIDQIDITCFGGRDGSLTFLPQGGTPSYTYSLDGTTFNGSNVQIGLTAGTYPAYIRDILGCEAFLGDYTVEEPDQLTVDFDGPILIEYGEALTLQPIINGGFGNLSFTYNPEDSLTLSCLTCQNPVVTPENTTSYEVSVIDENGCTASAFVLVVVEKDRPVYVPTGFTPNGDGNNDVLRIHGKQIQNILTYRVYDRWGSLVFEALDYPYDPLDDTVGWDGTFKGKEMGSGVFVWFVQVEYVDGNIADFKGNTTLIRN